MGSIFASAYKKRFWARLVSQRRETRLALAAEPWKNLTIRKRRLGQGRSNFRLRTSAERLESCQRGRMICRQGAGVPDSVFHLKSTNYRLPVQKGARASAMVTAKRGVWEGKSGTGHFCSKKTNVAPEQSNGHHLFPKARGGAFSTQF